MLMYLLPTHPQPGCCGPALPRCQVSRFSAHRSIEDFGQVTINADSSGENGGVHLGALPGSGWNSSALPAVVCLQGEGKGKE